MELPASASFKTRKDDGYESFSLLTGQLNVFEMPEDVLCNVSGTVESWSDFHELDGHFDGLRVTTLQFRYASTKAARKCQTIVFLVKDRARCVMGFAVRLGTERLFDLRLQFLKSRSVPSDRISVIIHLSGANEAC